jgi:hypothetical protein
MEKFIKTQGRDPFVKFESDSALAMFGHLNALVDAITILQETGGGGGGGNPVSIWKNSTEFSSAVSKLVFTGNGVNLQPGSSLSEVIVNVPGFNINNISVNSIDLNKLKDISSQTLLGRYSSGTGSVQTITLDPSLSLNSSTGVLSVTNPPITVQGTTNRISVTSNVNDRTFDLVPTGIGTGTIGNKNTVPKLTYDTYGRITTVSSESIDTIALTTGTISGTPSNANDIANKSYVDNFAQGLKPKASVRLATTANITSLSGNTAIIDGVRVSVGDRILVKDQTNPANNGVYVVANPGAWTRATDYDSPAEAVDGSFVFVRQGTLNGSSGFVQISVVTTIGVSPITFAQFSAAGTYTAGTGLNLTGSQFSLTTISPALNTGTTYGNSSQVGQFTVDAQGRLSSATNVSITLDASTNQITGLLPVTKGGTGLISYTAGDILYATGNTTLAKLAGGTTNNGKVLTIVSGLPSWQTAPTGFTNPLTATGDILYRSASSAADRLQIGSQGQFLRVSSSLLPVWETVNLLTNPMNSLGDMIIGGSLGVPTVLDGSTATAGHVLTYTNSGPVWQVATGGVTSVSAGSTGLLPNSPSTGAVVLSGTLNEVNGGTGLNSYVKGDILIADGANSLTKLTVSTTPNQVLTSDPSAATGVKWATPTGGMSNPMTTTGDIIYGSTTGSPSTPARLAPNTAATDRFLRSNSSANGGIPSWEAVPIQKTVVSFVIDGYGGPLTGSSTVFIANIPFGASYNSFTIQGDFAPSGTIGTNTVTLAVNGMSTSITASTINSNVTTPVINIPSTGGTLTFSLTVTGPSVATTKLFVNLTGTRS